MPPVRRASCLGSACVDTALPLERFVVSSGGLRQVVRSGAASVRHLAGGWERAALLRPQPRAHHRRLPQRERRPTSLPRTTAPPCPATHHRRLPQPDCCRAAPAQGDFVANWYSTNCGEEGRCVGLVQSRLKKGAAAWTTAQIQLDAPDRNQCCVSAAGQLPLRLLPPSQRSGCAQTAFYFDRDSGVLYHWSAMSAAGSFQDIMGTLQWSTDCVSRDSPPCCFC